MRKNLQSQNVATNPTSTLWRQRVVRLLSVFLPFMLLAHFAQAQFTVEFDVTEPMCFGLPTGSATAIPIGGQPPFDYLWNTGATTQTISNIPAGLYTVTVTDDNSFQVIKNVIVDEPDLVTVDLVANQCELPIIITATGNGGIPPYNYAWNIPGESGPVVEAPGPGTYCVTMTDQNLCGAVECITVDFNPLSVDVVATDVTCPGNDDGSIEAIPSGGTPPYTYLWSTGETTAEISNLGPGTYSVTVVDAALCEDTASVTIDQAPELFGSISGQQLICDPDGSGSATASASGGTPPYMYEWSNGATTQSITNLDSGTYSVTITDAQGCFVVESITITVVDDFVLDIAVQNVLCEGDSTGSILAEGWGGTPPYTYEWSTGETGTPMIENLPAGNYSVTVTEQNGCEIIEDFVVTEPPLLELTINGSTETCPGEANGSAMAMGTGGTPPYTYEWSTGSTNQMVSGLAAGTYTVTLTDDNDCEAVDSITITESPDINLVVTGTETVCPPNTLGSATATVSGGTPPFSILWSNGDTSLTITDLPEGTYAVTVTDFLGCTAVDSIFIDVVDDLVITGIVKDVLCFGESTGEITASASGGTPPYTYEWGTGETTAMITGLAAGTYTVTATDANDCTVSQTFTVDEPPLLMADATADGTVCPGESTGVVMAMGMGGTPPYTYAWSTGDNTQTVDNLPAGTYTVTVTDANNCNATADVTIEESEEVTVTIDAPEVVCGAGETGFAMAEVTGGTPPFFYNWSTGESGPDLDQIEDLPEGTYFVTVTDANGCTAIEEVTIEVIDDFSVSVSPRDVLCFGGNSGSILLIPSGGSAPYTYEWSTGATTNEIINLAAGTYSYTVTDDNGCEITGSEEISEPPLLELNLLTTDIECEGDDNGQIVAEVMGGTPPYNFDWSNGEQTAVVSNLSPGTYSVTITDANFCTTMGTATITAPDSIAITLTAIDVLCFGESTGGVSSVVTGGTPPYDYEWSTGAIAADLNGVPAGTFSLTVTDANDCSATADATVNEPDEFTVSLDIMDIFCDESETGSITANPVGGTPPYTYEWSNTQTGQTITGLGAGDYTVTVTDLNECTVVATGTVEFFPGLMLTPIASSPDCFGESTGAAAVTISGGTPPFTYEWDNGATTSELIDIPAGVYMVTVTDAVGCKGEETIGVAEPPQLIGQVSSTQTQDASCNGESDGQASVEVNGGTPPYSFDWSNGEDTQTITGLSAGTYDVTITDANDCTDELSVTIDEPAAIIVDITLDNSSTCENTADGAATASASGGTAPYTFDWSNGEEGASVTGLAAGNYTVTVTDANECTTTTTVIIDAFPSPNCTIEVLSQVSLAGNDGELTINVTGGTPPYTYLWDGGQTSQSLSGLSAGDYSATVTDANGCQTSCSATLAPPAKIGDFVWNDEDRDGIQDPGEEGIEGVMVILQLPGESTPIDIDTTFTDADGLYFFNVLPGEYKVTFVLPDGLIFSDPDQGTNDAIDSDADPTTGMTGVYVIGPGEINLTIDAGMFTKCDNIDDPGLIGPNQFLCGPGNDPDPIINVESPSGGSGQLEYLWMKSTIPGPFNIQTWEVIPGATGPDYDPGPLSETTYFARCARRECCTVYLESNIVTIEVGNVAVAEINGPDFLCVGEPTTFFAGPTGSDAVITWSFSAGVSPQTATGPQVSIQVNSLGSYTITLQVTENGCTSTDVETINATNSPIYCGGSMGLVAEVEDEESGLIAINWMVEEFLRDHTFTLEHSRDGERFEDLVVVKEPSALLGVMNYYEHMHESAKRGRNIYRVRVENRAGDIFYSEEAEAILYGDSKVAMLYPNPVEDIATLELFETFGEEATAELINANGAIILRRQADADTKQLQFDLSSLPSGTYFLRLNYSRSANKVYKLIKR